MEHNSYMSGKKHFRVLEFEDLYKKSEETVTLHDRIKIIGRKLCTKKWLKGCVHSNLPFIENLRKYKIKDNILSDVIAGITIGIMQIPIGMAYGLLADLPPICGLYVAFFGPLIYFFMGTSRHASLGPISTISLMIASVLDTAVRQEPLNEHIIYNNTVNLTGSYYNTSEFNQRNLIANFPGQFSNIETRKIAVATAISFLSGLIMIILGKCRLGVIGVYMSDPMVSGFTSAIGVHVTVSQIKELLGVTGVPRFNGAFKSIKTLISLFRNISTFNLATFLTSVVAMMVMYITKVHINERFKSRMKIPIPIEIIVVILATTACHFGKFESNYNVKVLREIPVGLPLPSIPDVGLSLPYFKDAIILGVVAFTQSYSISKILARKDNYSIQPSQEMVAYGAGSIISSVFSGFIPAGSVARSSVQYGAGGKSQIASLFSCVVVLVVIMAVGPLFYSLPKCVLTAVVIVNLRGMYLQFLEIPDLWKTSKYDFSIWIVTHLCSVILDADIGIAVGIIYSVLTVSIRTQRTSPLRTGYTDGSNILRNIQQYNSVTEESHLRIIEYQAPIYFANSELLVKRTYKVVGIDPERVKKEQKHLKRNTDAEYIVKAESGDSSEQNGNVKDDLLLSTMNASSIIGDVRNVILDFRGVTFVDIVGVKALRRIFSDYEEIGIHVFITHVNDNVLTILEKTRFLEEKSDFIFMTTDSVIQMLSKGHFDTKIIPNVDTSSISIK